eukprot:TRINITY_DN744_c0_g1_i2.p1 TRINITY_DN744_c0_g1~~TRINITY_DN744_c0_g1_i2.p1  ORF type:complete len:162 (-),score=15.99 TRINITY_DN744_c0_g1_i2:63-548(-)
MLRTNMILNAALVIFMISNFIQDGCAKTEYEIRQLQPLMMDKLANNWGIGNGGPYEYNRWFWRGSPGVGYGYGPNVWWNMGLLGNQLKFTYSKKSPRGYKGPLTNGVTRRRMEKRRESMLEHDMETGKYDYEMNKFGVSQWQDLSIIERQAMFRGEYHDIF